MELYEARKEKIDIDFKLKVILAGQMSIGKTIFINRLRCNINNYNEFQKIPTNYIETVGVDFLFRFIKFKNKVFNLQIWDLAGTERFKSIASSYFRGFNVALIFFDAWERSSFQRDKNIVIELFDRENNTSKDAIIILIRSKYGNSGNNKNNENYVSEEEALEFADKNKLLFAHISCFQKYETGIEELLSLILHKFYKDN